MKWDFFLFNDLKRNKFVGGCFVLDKGRVELKYPQLVCIHYKQK
jgi:hypothetical protein